MLNLVLHSLGLLSGVLAIQQADAGTVDWHKALIGLPTSKFSILDDLAIATTDAGVIAALHVSNGSVGGCFHSASCFIHEANQSA